MKTQYCIYILTAFILLLFWSCEQDLVVPELSDNAINLRAKGGKGKPDKGVPAITIYDLGTLPGHQRSIAHDVKVINGIIHVVGESGSRWDTSMHAFAWTADANEIGSGQMADINPDPEWTSRAYSINSSGRIAGTIERYDEVGPWDSAGYWIGAQFYGLGWQDSWAVDINNYNDIVGITGYGPAHAWAWWTDDESEDLGTLYNEDGIASGINNNGVIVGYEGDLNWSFVALDLGEEQATYGFRWSTTGGMEDITSLLTAFSGDRANALAINDENQIVGAAFTGTHRDAVLLDSDDTPVMLGSLNGTGASWAKDINNTSFIVGASNVEASKYHAFFWTETQGMQDLGALKGGNSEAYAVSELQGNIVYICGTSTSRVKGNQTEPHAILWTVDLSLL